MSVDELKEILSNETLSKVLRVQLLFQKQNNTKVLVLRLMTTLTFDR